MWKEKILKVFPAAMFLFCVLNILELCLTIEDMNKTERLENEIKKNLEMLETITELLNGYSKCMQLEERPEIKIFKNRSK